MKQEILVIDDNFDIRNLVSNLLKDKNYQIRQAANYDQAIFEINKKCREKLVAPRNIKTIIVHVTISL